MYSTQSQGKTLNGGPVVQVVGDSIKIRDPLINVNSTSNKSVKSDDGGRRTETTTATTMIRNEECTLNDVSGDATTRRIEAIEGAHTHTHTQNSRCAR